MPIALRLAALLLVAGTALAAPPASPEELYVAARERLTERRRTLADEWARAKTDAARERVLGLARETLLAALRDELMPPWFGTRWDFYGMSEVPRKGTIACGYFVSTLLRDAGLKVERIRLAQQASAHIVRTLVPGDAVRRYRRMDPESVVTALRARGEGLYVVGFDFHVGFVVVRGEKVEFCHASYVGPATVTCEDPAGSGAFPSELYVAGAVTNDATIVKWLEGQRFPTLRG